MSGQALVHLFAGEQIAAEQIMAVAPPGDLGFDLTYRWKLVTSLVSLARGAHALAQTQAQAANEWAKQKGYSHKNDLAQKLLDTPELSLADALTLLLVGD